MFQQTSVFYLSTIKFAALLMFMLSIGILPAKAQVLSTVTHLMVSNGTSQAVTMYVTLQAHSAYTEDGCTASVGDLQMTNMTVGLPQTSTPITGSGTQGTFSIPSMYTYELTSTLVNPYASGGPQAQDCLQGIEITFNQPPQCPSNSVPNGVNGGEPTLNMPGTIGGQTGGNAGVGEACDVTCLNGANSLIQLAITPPSSSVDPQLWTYDVSNTVAAGSTFTTENSWVLYGANGCDDNCSPERAGVYPFGCSQCNRFPDPGPPCGQYCAAANGLGPNLGCVMSRYPNTANLPGAQYGGTVQYTYMGPAVPPATCKQSQQGEIRGVKVKQYVVKDYHITYITKPNGTVVAVKHPPYTSKVITVETILYHH